MHWQNAAGWQVKFLFSLIVIFFMMISRLLPGLIDMVDTTIANCLLKIDYYGFPPRIFAKTIRPTNKAPR